MQARFDRRVADPGARLAAATLIEEWRQRSLSGSQKPSPDAAVDDWTDGKLMAEISIRRNLEGPPTPANLARAIKPPRAPRKQHRPRSR